MGAWTSSLQPWGLSVIMGLSLLPDLFDLREHDLFRACSLALSLYLAMFTVYQADMNICMNDECNGLVNEANKLMPKVVYFFPLIFHAHEHSCAFRCMADKANSLRLISSHATSLPDDETFGASWQQKSRHFKLAPQCPVKVLHLLPSIIFHISLNFCQCFTRCSQAQNRMSFQLTFSTIAAPIQNVKQIRHGALIVNNLAQALGSANRGASTFSSYQGLLFLQLPSCLYLRQVSW